MKKAIHLFIILSLLVSCKTQQKTSDIPFLDTSERKADTIRITNEITKTDTIQLPGETITKTVTVDCPPSPTPSVITKEVKTPCPPAKEITITKWKHDSITIIKEDMRRIQPLTDIIHQKDAEINIKDAKINKSERWRGINKWIGITGWLLVVLLILGIYIAYKRPKLPL